MKRVSVVTVCFNSSKTIKRTLESVNRQTYPNIEHIIIDGNSSDNTLIIIAEYKLRLGPIVSETDQGIYDAMNKGLSLATGDIICFLNSDDKYCSENLIAEVVDIFSENNLDILYGDVIYETQAGKQVRYYSSKKFTAKSLKYGLMPAHPSLFVKGNIYKKLGLFNVEFDIAGDFEMCCRLFTTPNLRINYIEKPFVTMLPGGASAVSARKILAVNREIRNACFINKIDTSYGKLFLRYFGKFRELTWMVR